MKNKQNDNLNEYFYPDVHRFTPEDLIGSRFYFKASSLVYYICSNSFCTYKEAKIVNYHDFLSSVIFGSHQVLHFLS